MSEKRVFTIPVGDLSQEEAEKLVKELKEKFNEEVDFPDYPDFPDVPVDRFKK